MKSFGVWLGEERAKQGLTLDEVAEASGVSKTSVYHTEKEVSGPRLDTAERLATALGFPLSKVIAKLESEGGKGSRR